MEDGLTKRILHGHPLVLSSSVGLISIFLLNSFWFTAYSYAISSLPSASTSSSSATASSAAKLPSVKIISPKKGQQVPVNSILVVTGTASAPSQSSATTSNKTSNKCIVSLSLNGIKPYQRVVSTGHGGRNDYSSWQYYVAPNYASIMQGQNKVTAKVTCGTNIANNVTKFNSVNVTGVVAPSLAVNGQNGKNGANGASGLFFGGHGGNGGTGGNGGNANGGNGGIALGGQGGNGGNGGSANGGNGGNGGRGGNGGSAVGGNGGIAIGGNGGRGGNGGNG
jgi:hypothetical protein